MTPTASTDFYPIVGIQEGLDKKENELREVPVRMEIDKWYSSQETVHKNQRALFFPAFKAFCDTPPDKKLSYFQIAGIHGLPYVSWDEKPQSGLGPGGYCTHNSVLFTTWHRPYMLLFEQVIHEHMKREVDAFPSGDQQALRDAARTWRLPYWDTALKKPTADASTSSGYDYTIPDVFNLEEVKIRRPGESVEQPYRNALYKFTMPRKDGKDTITMGDISLVGTDPDIPKEQQDLRIIDLPPKVVPNTVWSRCESTSRYPTYKDETKQVAGSSGDIFTEWVKGIQHNEGVAKNLRDFEPSLPGPEEKATTSKQGTPHGKSTASLRDAFYRLSTIDTFEDFASTRMAGKKWNDKDNRKSKTRQDMAYDSVEGFHNVIHVLVGGTSAQAQDQDGKPVVVGGHMSSVPVSAFDPIFWFHHCNIDRMAAIWHGIWGEDTWFDGTDLRDQDEGNFAISPGQKDTPSDALRPFQYEKGNYWTSKMARYTSDLGYTYPGLEKWLYKNPDGTYNREGHKSAIKKMMNENYGSSRSAAFKSLLSVDPGHPGSGVEFGKLSTMQAAASWEPVDITINDYVVNVIYEKFALGGRPFTVYIFIGAVPGNPPYRYDDPTASIVGEVVNFSAEPGSLGTSVEEGCGNCQQQVEDHAIATGRVVLTNSLITRWKNEMVHDPRSGDSGVAVLKSLEPADVVPFLKDNLHWRVVSRGQLIQPADLPSLKVSLAAGKADHFVDESKLSRFYDYKGAFEVTQGRPGGAGPEDGLYPDED